MKVLYNGEYTEFDITTVPQWENLLQQQKAFYSQFEGKIYGDFEMVKIEWDWFLRKQRALLRCVHCGFEKYANNPREFRRGKSTSQKCQCQKPQKIEKPKKEVVKYSEYIGEYRHGFYCVDYTPGKGMLVRCWECDKEKKVTGKDFVEGRITCDHKNEEKEDVIGKTFGDLTILEKRDSVYLCRCACGFERELERYRFVNGITRTCGRPECEYHIKRRGSVEAEKHRKEGLEFEHKLQDVFENAGYEVIRTSDSHDYGVDFIVFINGEKWAFQCKKMKVAATAHAVMEVYSGGRFYDCTRFCVASPSGFTSQAMKMAAKLGVQLETNEFRFNVSLNENTVELLKIANYTASGKKEKEWTINGVTKAKSEWCKEYNAIPRQVEYRISNGMSVIEALTYVKPIKTLEFDGVTKTLNEWCKHFGISKPLYDYRIQCGMTPYEAFTTPKRGGYKKHTA